MRRRFAFASLALLAASFGSAQNYSVKALGIETNGYGAALGNDGYVAGYADTFDGPQAASANGSTIHTLGSGLSIANGAHATGGIAGFSTVSKNGVEVGGRATVWSHSSVTVYDSLGTDANGLGWGAAQAINASGTAVGVSNLIVDGTEYGPRAALYQNGVTTNLGAVGIDASGYGNSMARAINGSDTAVGMSVVYDNGSERGTVATLFANGAATSLGYLGTDASGRFYSEAFGINDAGVAVGTSTKYGAGGSFVGDRAVLWQNGQTTELGTLMGGAGFSQGYGINNHGVVVGRSEASINGHIDDRAFIYDGTSMRDLNSLLGPTATGWVLEQARAINDRGEILAYGRLNGGSLTAVIVNAQPVPEPATFAVVGLGLAVLSRRRRRA